MAIQSGILLKSGTNEFEIIEFYIDEIKDDGLYRGSYGINVAKVVEIIQQPKTTLLPMAPREILGTFLFRGRVIPLVALATWLGKTKPQEQTNPLAIVTNVYLDSRKFSGLCRDQAACSWGLTRPLERMSRKVPADRTFRLLKNSA